MTAEPELAKLPLLIKLMGMTTSANDGEASAAMRKANELLRSAGWTWEKLLLGKVTVIADPFSAIATPPKPQEAPPSYHTPSRPTPARQTPPRQPYTPPPAYNPAPPPPTPHSTRTNQHPGNCYCCGHWVIAGGGFITPNPISSKPAFVVLCSYDNKRGMRPLPAKPAKRQRASTDSLLNDI